MMDYKILNFKIASPYSLEISFNDGTNRLIDFFPILKGQMYGPLAEKAYFDKVYLDNEVHTLSWPNGADFDPEVLYNWELYKNELFERAKSWS